MYLSTNNDLLGYSFGYFLAALDCVCQLKNPNIFNSWLKVVLTFATIAETSPKENRTDIWDSSNPLTARSDCHATSPYNISIHDPADR